MKLPSHGANPNYIYEAMNLQMPEQYLDFSANINPLGPPAILKGNWKKLYNATTSYPDPFANTLRNTISQQEDVDKNEVLIGNGGAELINLVSRMLTGKKVMIVEPTFSEYERSCQTNDCFIFYHQLHAPDWDLQVKVLIERLRGMDALFLCNPNNPTGVSYPKETVMQLMDACQQSGCYLILDEAFYDMTDHSDSVLSSTKAYPNLIIIRSLTKMFAVPGLRLGYVIAQPSIIKQLACYQSSWSVNAVALAAGSLCLQDRAFIVRTQTYIRNERKKMFVFYQKEGFVVSPSSVNFYLVKDSTYKDQHLLFKYLLQKGIVPRHTNNFPGLNGKWLRFAIKSADENERLMEVLYKWKPRRL